MEPETDPLGLHHDHTNKMEENKGLSQQDNSFNLQSTAMKTEYVDHSYDLISEIKVEGSPVSVNFPVEDPFDLDRVKEEVKLEVSSEEDEVLTESIADDLEKSMSSLPEGISLEGDKSKQNHSHRVDDSNGRDIGHNSIKNNISNENFVTLKSLKPHFRTRKRTKLLKCPVCGKCFQYLCKLKRHNLLHTGEKPLHCDVCGKSFREYGNLKKHIRSHTGERPFKCDVCGKCFSESGSLAKHARVHAGDRPYKCDVCGKCFRICNVSKDTYANTQARHHINVKCVESVTPLRVV
ncbi:hypothetical protein ANN_27451 [Periplaneta americana]|uniref:C2H2-type domain-containing protein n=1 Tax=Periplaneta americana TaxID=6978 RepID=A0ABQ8RW04_PERAM|nr:hypothetical protein ANN_27451 [Periplaneta americana]